MPTPSKKVKDYERIERSYNNFLERDADLVYTLGATDQEDVSSGGSSGGGSMAESGTLGDVTVDGSITSELWQPQNSGFYLDARTGYAELNNARIEGEVVGYVKASGGSFGGDGSDGALEVSSGTTQIDAVNAEVIVKNYTNVSITGTGKVELINPATKGTILILKSQGDITITSSTIPSLDLSGCGADGGNGAGIGADGNPGSAGTAVPYNLTGPTGGGAGVGAGDGSGGTAPYASYDPEMAAYTRSNFYICGSGGGGGKGGATGAGGDGGRGGGCLVIECGGDFEFTSVNGISVAGDNGSNGVSDGGGGGGGGAGMALIFYKTVLAATGTVNVDGGDGGTSGGANSGGGGASIKYDGTGGSAGGGPGGGGTGVVILNSVIA